MVHAAISAARHFKKCSPALPSCQDWGVFQSSVTSNWRLCVGTSFTSGFCDLPAADSTSELPAKPALRGAGLKQRLKDTPSAELRQLLRRTTEYDKRSSQAERYEAAKPNTLSQWNRLDLSIVAPYTTNDIALKDIFAVIEAGPTQYKVVADDKIFVHKMEGVDVDDVVQFNRVLLAGTPNETLVGRPFVQGMQVLAAVEEQIRDATTYIYKRKRASGYRRFRGFRAELTALRILQIAGVKHYGIDVPDWQEQRSTDLRDMDSFAHQVRTRRRRMRAAQRRQDTDAVIAHLESGQDYGVVSYTEPIATPYKPISSS
eukprot:jgi/Ulvmu1/4399/UM002_0124.1